MDRFIHVNMDLITFFQNREYTAECCDSWDENEVRSFLSNNPVTASDIDKVCTEEWDMGLVEFVLVHTINSRLLRGYSVQDLIPLADKTEVCGDEFDWTGAFVYPAIKYEEYCIMHDGLVRLANKTDRHHHWITLTRSLITRILEAAYERKSLSVILQHMCKKDVNFNEYLSTVTRIRGTVLADEILPITESFLLHK